MLCAVAAAQLKNAKPMVHSQHPPPIDAGVRCSLCRTGGFSLSEEVGQHSVSQERSMVPPAAGSQ